MILYRHGTAKTYISALQQSTEDNHGTAGTRATRSAHANFVGMSGRLDPRTVNLHISAVKFFYRTVLGKGIQANYMKKPTKIPDALSKEETHVSNAVIKCVKSPLDTL